MENLFKKYLRWRHTKGFGIHSPFAFNLINDLFNFKGYGLYGYHEIDHAIFVRKQLPAKNKEEARLYLRLLTALKCKRVVTSASNKSTILTLGGNILHIPVISGREKNIKLKAGDLVVVSKDSDCPLVDKGVNENVTAILALNPDKTLRLHMEKPREKGVLLSGTTRLLLIPRQETEYVAYDIMF